MVKTKFLTAKRKNRIRNNDQARNAIDFVLDLLEAEKQHVEETESSAYASVSRLEAAHILDSLAHDLEDYMD